MGYLFIGGGRFGMKQQLAKYGGSFFLKLTVLLISGFFIWAYMGNYLMPDRCLDAGGSFDYSMWQCSLLENMPYKDVAFYRVPGFAFAFGSILVLIAVVTGLRHTKS